jgi:hypothetical protein
MRAGQENVVLKEKPTVGEAYWKPRAGKKNQVLWLVILSHAKISLSFSPNAKRLPFK